MVQDFAMIRESKSRNLAVKRSISTQVGLWVGCGVCAGHLFSAGPFCIVSKQQDELSACLFANRMQPDGDSYQLQ
jgi:hypothetical protein